MNEELTEIMYAAMFDELNSIEKESMDKEAIIGAISKGIGVLPKAVQPAAQAATGLFAKGGLRGAGQAMKGAYQAAGGGLKGVGAAMRTPIGQAATAAGGAGLLAGTGLAGVGIGRATAPRR